MGEAVKDMTVPCNGSGRQAIELLIEEEACLLPVFHVDRVADAVFHNACRRRLCLRIEERRIKESLELFHAFQFPDLHVISFING